LFFTILIIFLFYLVKMKHFRQKFQFGCHNCCYCWFVV